MDVLLHMVYELFSTGICLGLELGRLSSARQAPDPLTAPCAR